MKAEIIKLGSMYLGEESLAVDTSLFEEVPSLGDTVPGKELTWVRAGNLMVADRCLCHGVSWVQIHERGFIFGQPVQIDGKAYLCRSLRAGAAEGEPNEWDDLLDQFGKSNSLWHWKKMYFWGQETVIDCDLEYRAVRGGETARTWTFLQPKRDPFDVGFRPVLEPFNPIPILTGAALGCRVKLYGPRGEMVTGILAGFDDYDVVLTETPLQAQPSVGAASPDWLTLTAENAVANRKAISLIQRI